MLYIGVTRISLVIFFSINLSLAGAYKLWTLFMPFPSTNYNCWSTTFATCSALVVFHWTCLLPSREELVFLLDPSRPELGKGTRNYLSSCAGCTLVIGHYHSGSAKYTL